MVDQAMRDGKGVHTIRDLCYHREKGAEKTLGGMAANTSKVRGGTKHLRPSLLLSKRSKLQKFTPLGLLSWVTVTYFAP